MNRTVTALRPSGETVFATVGKLVVQHSAVNLGQGKPDFDSPPAVLREARAQIAAGNNQYAPSRGQMVLREAVCSDRNARLGENRNPATDCVVTVGATEAIAATVLGLVEPGSHVILIEPYYDSYPATVALAGATYTAVPMRHDGASWHLDLPAIREALRPETGMVIINSPHNPTGTVYGREELAGLAELVVEADLLVLADEVYEHLVIDGTAEHVSIATLPGMRERTVVASSGGKTFNVTGWKIGWALGAPDLIDAVNSAKQWLTFGGAAPLEPAVAAGLTDPGSARWLRELRDTLRGNHDLLLERLASMGLTASPARAGYFVLVDGSPVIEAVNALPAVQAAGIRATNAHELCMIMPEYAGIGAIPVSAFVEEKNDPRWANLLRLSFCQRRESVSRALDKLEELLRG